VGLGQKTRMEWFSALGIAKHKKSLKKANASAFPFQG
jgi:hypothetical protein